MSAALYKALRFVSRGVSRSILPEPDKTILSFGFDDCPKSAIETALPMLEAEGWNATIYVACGLCETENHLGRHMALSDIVDVHERGHEIADHTYSHFSSHEMNTLDYMADIEKNQKTLRELGVPSSQHFAYPYGHVTPALKRALRRKFRTLRGVVSSNSTSQDANLLNAVRVYSGRDLQTAFDKIKAAKTAPKWLHLFTHDVRKNPSDFGCTPDEFQTVIKAVKQAGHRVMTVDEAYRTISSKRASS